MNNIVSLIRGELTRLYKYKILVFGIIVSVIWALIIGLSEKADIEELIPMLIMVDAAMMNIILLAASFFFEKQEGTIKSMLVSPVRLLDILIAKIVAACVVALISATLVMGVSMIVHNISINIFLLIIYIIIIVFAHTGIGFLITLYSRDFGSVIGFYAVYALLAFIPSILFMLEIISSDFELLLIISPSYASQVLLNSLFVSVDILPLIISLLYLILLGVILYVGVVYRRFKDYAIGG